MVATTFLALRQTILSTGWSKYPLQRTIQRVLYFGIPVSLLLVGWLFHVGAIIYWIATNLVSSAQRRWTVQMMRTELRPN